MQRWSSWLMASASKAEEPQGSGGSNPSFSAEFTGQKWSVNGQKATNK